MLLPGVNSSVQAIALLGIAAVQINLALLFFNLLPIPPLDGSHLLRNVLPYNAVQSYDRIPMWVSWMLMIFVGGYIMRLLLDSCFCHSRSRADQGVGAEPAATMKRASL